MLCSTITALWRWWCGGRGSTRVANGCVWVCSITTCGGVSGGGIVLCARMGVGAIPALGWICGSRAVNVVVLWGMGVCSITRCLWFRVVIVIGGGS